MLSAHHHPRLRPAKLAGVGLAALVAALVLFVPGCSGAVGPSPVDLAYACAGTALTPGPCDEPWSTGPDPILPENRCPTAADVERIQSEVPLTVHGDATQGALACRAEDGSVDLTPAQAAIYRGLLFMRRVRFDAPLPWTDKPLYDWVREAIPNGVVLIASGNSYSCYNCPGPVYIYWPSGTRAVGVDVVGAASIIVHETRHTENIKHTCKSVAPWGNTLDRTIAEMGSMGVDYYLRHWIATHSDEHPDTREYERRSAARLRRAFCCECPPQTFAGLRDGGLSPLLVPKRARGATGCGG